MKKNIKTLIKLKTKNPFNFLDVNPNRTFIFLGIAKLKLFLKLLISF